MVSEWMENGTMNKYLKDHTEANVLKLVGTVTPTCALVDSDV